MTATMSCGVASMRTTTPAPVPERGIICEECRTPAAVLVSDASIAWRNVCVECWSTFQAKTGKAGG
jgi:hypothetical protein